MENPRITLQTAGFVWSARFLSGKDTLRHTGFCATATPGCHCCTLGLVKWHGDTSQGVQGPRQGEGGEGRRGETASPVWEGLNGDVTESAPCKEKTYARSVLYSTQHKSWGPFQALSYFLAYLFIVINTSVGPSAGLCQEDSSNRQLSGITKGKKITTLASG